jgi:hypothetical protein
MSSHHCRRQLVTMAAIFVAGGGCLPSAAAAGDQKSNVVVECKTAPARDGGPSVVVTPDCRVISAGGGADPFKGLHWGLGVLYSSSLGGVGEVRKDAAGVVHVTRENAGAARAAFEMHYFFKMCWQTPSLMSSLISFPAPPEEYADKGCGPNKYAFGIGPFASLNTSPLDNISGTRVFDSMGIGVMLGLNAFDDPSPAQQAKFHSVNLGIGAIIDTRVKDLAPGVLEGRVSALPEGLLTRETTRVGFQVMLSYKLFTFNLSN